MKKSKESFVLPAHQHIELKAKGITYNDDHKLKYRPFEKLREMMKKHG